MQTRALLRLCCLHSSERLQPAPVCHTRKSRAFLFLPSPSHILLILGFVKHLLKNDWHSLQISKGVRSKAVFLCLSRPCSFQTFLAPVSGGDRAGGIEREGVKGEPGVLCSISHKVLQKSSLDHWRFISHLSNSTLLDTKVSLGL